MKRLLPMLLILVAALVGAGCGGEHEPRTEAETEGLYLDIGGAKYQIQMSRQLNPADEEDKGYLVGLPEGTTAPGAEDTWFAVFLRVENVSDEPVDPATEFSIEDTDEHTYTPIELDTEKNVFAYNPEPIPPDELLPHADSLAGMGPTNGALVLFKLPIDAFANRPLVFKIQGADGEAHVNLDL